MKVRLINATILLPNVSRVRCPLLSRVVIPPVLEGKCAIAGEDEE